MKFAMAAGTLACLLILSPVRGHDLDSDGDGLSDYQEIHKYRTNPHKADTAGEGIPDGNWQQRREFTYSIRSILKIMPPVNVDHLCDDYQDARVLSKGENYVELEVVHYPLNTNASAITSNPNWKKDYAGMQEYLRPGRTTNWDAAMQRDLIARLRESGIEPDRLDDKELVTRVSKWVFEHTKSMNMFGTFYVHYPNGRAEIYPGLEQRFAIDKGNASWTPREQLEHELFGRSMFYNGTHGSCTSSAVLLTTVLRALGIPTRMVLAVPLVDPTDHAQVALVRKNIRHHRVRRAILLGLAGTHGFSNHTFNEVYVGNRWVRLNYTTLGADSLDPHYMGLLTRVNTFSDLSDTPLAATWGRRYALGQRDALFRHANPYKAEEVSDHFGKYAHVDNPEPPEHQSLTLSKVYWLDAPESPEFVRGQRGQDPPGARRAVAHIEEWIPSEPYTQYNVFLQAADKNFVLRAPRHDDVQGHVVGTVTSPPALHEVQILIPPDEYAKMAAGVDYVLEALNSKPGKGWKMKGRLTLKKDGTGAAPGRLANSPAVAQDGGARILAEPNILVSRDGSVPHFETAVAVNPRNTKNLLGTAIVLARAMNGKRTCKTYASKDGGYTWLDTAFPERLEYSSSDPQVGFGASGTAYFLTMSSAGGREANHFYRSRDGGLSWQRGGDVSTELADRVQLVVDHSTGKYSGRIYIAAWCGAREIGLVHSADDGRTFSQPLIVPFPEKAGDEVHGLTPVVAGDGTLYVAYVVPESRGEQQPFVFTVYSVESRDGGASFGQPLKVGDYRLAVNEVRDTYPLISSGLYPVLAVDPRPARPRIYMAAIDLRPEGHRVVLRSSADRGRTWSAPKVVASAPKGSQQYQPTLAVDRAGVVGIGWFDTRAFPRYDGYGLYFTASLDGGETFLEPRKVTSESSRPAGAGNRTPFPHPGGTDQGLTLRLETAVGAYPAGGDYSGLTAEADGTFRPFWADSRTGTFQLWTARVRVAKAALEETTNLSIRPVHQHLSLVCDPTDYDGQKEEGTLHIRLRNISQKWLYGPIKARVVKVVGCELRGHPELDFTPALRDLPGLEPGAVTEAMSLGFRKSRATLPWPTLTLEVTARTRDRPEN